MLDSIHARSLSFVLAGLVGCASTGDDPDDVERYRAGVVRSIDQPIGKLLADVDAQVQVWSRLILTANNEAEQVKARGLELNLARITKPRIDEIIEQLESGAPVNRIRAAIALGFTKLPSAQQPLLSALFDPEPDVISNALISLGNLQRADTPLERVCELAQFHPDAQLRSNAYRAALFTLDSGGGAPCVLEAARSGLADPDPFSRAQSALILGILEDADSIASLKDLLTDEHALVARAGAEALSGIAERVGEHRGEAVRALALAFGKSEGRRHDMLLAHLVRIAGEHHGDEPEDWLEWANNLP